MYKSLQSGRAIAAILVLLFHIGVTVADPKYFDIPNFAKPFLFGDSGVDFFFVLSGFIIFHVHKSDLGHRARFSQYLYKRLTRIYPVYLLLFLSVYALALSIPSLKNTLPSDSITLIKSLMLLPQDPAVVGRTGAPVLVVAWTLQFEMMFYLAFGVAILSRRMGMILLTVYLVGAALGLAKLGFPYSFVFSEYVLLFLMGMGVAKLVTLPTMLSIRPMYFALSGLAVYIPCALFSVFEFEINEALQTLMYGFACSLIVLALISYETKEVVFLSQPSFQLIGAASYALYLIHFPLISILCKMSMIIGLNNFGLWGAMVASLVMAILCIVVSIVFHLMIEKPIAKGLNSLFNSWQVSRVVQTS